MLDVLNWAFWIGAVALIFVALASVWLWGGARRNALGHLAAGALLLVSGTLFLHVIQINVYARMDNAYLGNAILGSYFVVLGALLLMASTAGYGPWWIAAALLVGVVALYLRGVTWLARAFSFRDSDTLLFAAAVLAATFLYVMLREHGRDAALAVLLAAVGSALVWLAYGAGTRAFVPVEVIGADEYKPPVLGAVPCAVALLVAAGLFVLGRRLRRPVSAAPRTSACATGA